MIKQFGVASLAAVLPAGCRAVSGPLEPASSEPQQNASFSPSSGSNLFQQRFERSTGEPITVTANVPMPEHVKEATLRLVNGPPDGKHRVSAATVTITTAG